MKKFSFIEKIGDDETRAEIEIKRRFQSFKTECNLFIIFWLVAGIVAFILLLTLCHSATCILGLFGSALGLVILPIKKWGVERYERQLEELKALRERAETSSKSRFEEETKKEE